MKKKLKSVIVLIGILALTFGMNSFVFAADDIVLDGDSGTSSFIGKFSADAASGYKYLGFVTSKEATSEYKYLELTYTGDIMYLRIEFNRLDDSNEGPYWFNAEGQTLFFKTVDGSEIPLKADKATTIVLDLSAIGIDMGDFRGMHLHYLAPDQTKGSFEIKNAKLMTSAPGAQTNTASNNSNSNNTNTGDDESDNSNSNDTKSGTNSKSKSASSQQAKGTQGTAGGSIDAPSTGSVMYPIVIAVGGIVVAGIAFVVSGKMKEEN